MLLSSRTVPKSPSLKHGAFVASLYDRVRSLFITRAMPTRRWQRRASGFQLLEARDLLSGAPIAYDDHYRTYTGGTFVVGVERGLLANDTAPDGSVVLATAVTQTDHGKLSLQADGALTYLPDAGFKGQDTFTYRLLEGATRSNVATVSLDVLPRSAIPKPREARGGSGTVSPLNSGVSPDDGAVLTIGDAEAKGGATLDFDVSLTNVPPDEESQVVEFDTYPGTAASPGDYQGIAAGDWFFDGNGGTTIALQTYDYGPRSDGTTQLTMGLHGFRVAPYPTPGAFGTGTIDLTPAPEDCDCSCGCGNVEPSTDQRDGTPVINSGQGPAPQDLAFHGNEEPHPIITIADTLSTTIASADDVMVQTDIDDMSGNVLNTAPALYFSAAGYTQGQQVDFSQQLDAAGLADGTYQYTVDVAEQYTSSGAPAVGRTYSGFLEIHNLDNSPYGSGWALHNVDRLVPQSGGATLLRGGGSALWFEEEEQDPGMPDGPTFSTPAGEWGNLQLSQNEDGTFTLTHRDKSQEVFAANGLLALALDKNGNQSTYQWNADSTLASVTDQSGRITQFAYSDGKLTSVTDFAGRVTSYGYTAGQLASIALPDPGHGQSQHVTTMGYDPTTGMLSTITDAGGTTTLHYNAFRQVISITDPDGTSTQYAAPSSMSLVDTSSGIGAQSDPAPLVYARDVQGSVTDGDGHTSSYTVDPATGETLSTTDATGIVTTQEQYSNTGQVTAVIQPPLTPGGAALTTTLDYDLSGNLVERDLPDGTKETWQFDWMWNEPTVYFDPAGRETDYTLDPDNGNVLSVTQVGQNGDPNLVTSYTYTPNPTAQDQTPGGLVATMIDPRGIETDYCYNTHGLVTSIVYAVGTADQASVSFTYDQNDNPASYTDELGRTTVFVFDNSDREVEEQGPPPDTSLPDVRPTLTWTYDTRGNMLKAIDGLNRATSYVYGPGSDGDEPDLDQIIQPDPAGGTNYTVTTYGHDNADNLTSITDPMSRLETIGLDADNRQTSITLPNPNGGGSGGPTESVVLNALGFPVQQFDLDGGETDNTFNWRGQVLTSVGPAVPDGQGGQARPTETLTYNNDGQTLTDQNPLLATTQYVYDSFGRLTEEILPDPDGDGPLASPTLHWGYDADGNTTSFQDSNGSLYVFAYNNRNELVEEDEPSPDGGQTPGPVWQWQYNAAGELVETIDPMNRVTQYVHDGDGNVFQTIAPNLTTGGPGDASTTTFDTYDLDNENISETTPNGATTTWQYNGLGQMVEETQPVPATGEAAPVWQYQYDLDNELLKATNPLGLTQTSTYNGLGQMTGQTSFAGVPTAWTYNNLSEILTETVGTGSLAQTTTNTWDALGDELSTQDANGTTNMAYDLAGHMTTLTDPDQNQTVWARDNLGRVTEEQNPSGTETFSYDTNSNLTKEVDFDGHERDFVFDDLNRETAEKWMDGGAAINTISTAYNADGQVTSTGDNFSDYEFGYNGQGDQTSVDNAGTPNAPHVVLTSQFDTQGNRTSLAATINGTADFINNYSFDALSRLRNITQQGQSGGNAVAPKSIYIGLDGVGDITELDYSNSVTQGQNHSGPGYATLSYSATTGLLTDIDDFANGTSIDDLAYTYDPLARVSTFASIDGTATYGYDHTSQLVSATYTTSPGGHQPNNVAFTWDANGNNDASGNVVSPNNEVTNDGTFTYTFDADGNRTSRTRISTSYATDYETTYSWDYRNRLTDVETFDNNGVLTKHIQYVYDVYDNLIEEDINPNGGGSYSTKDQFALDVSAKLPSAGNAPLETFDAAGNLEPGLPDDVLMELVNAQLAERFLNGPSPSGAGDVIYAEGAVASLFQPDVPDLMFVNNQGSPTDVIDSGGNLVDHNVYSPFGQLIYISNPGVFVLQGFSGGYSDPNSGLIKLGERWYDPLATVWISVDAAGFRAGQMNLSLYANNDPTNDVDTSGLVDKGGLPRGQPARDLGKFFKGCTLPPGYPLDYLRAYKKAAEDAIAKYRKEIISDLGKRTKDAIKDIRNMKKNIRTQLDRIKKINKVLRDAAAGAKSTLNCSPLPTWGGGAFNDVLDLYEWMNSDEDSYREWHREKYNDTPFFWTPMGPIWNRDYGVDRGGKPTV